MSDPLEQLEQLLPELPKALEKRNIGESLGKVATALADAPRQIERLKAILGTSGSTGFCDQPAQRASINDLLESADELAQLMLSATTSDQLSDVQHAYREFMPKLV